MQDTNSIDAEYNFLTPIYGKEDVDMRFVRISEGLASMIARELMQPIAERIKSQLYEKLGDTIPAGDLYFSTKYSVPEAMSFINGISVVSGKEPPTNE